MLPNWGRQDPKQSRSRAEAGARQEKGRSRAEQSRKRAGAGQELGRNWEGAG